MIFELWKNGRLGVPAFQTRLQRESGMM